ncbi:MAG: hypothetical protein IJR82_04820 [Bacilli bacterium]|nr:hypothetical protein [Bacilli bacterium]
MLSLSIKNYKAIDGVNKSYYLIFGIIFLLFNLSLFFDNSRPIVVENIIINCVFVILYLNLLYFFSLKNFKKIELFIISVIVIEIIYNYSTGILTKEKTDLPVNYKVYIESVCPKLNNLSKDFYRISGNENYGFIDSLLCNYHGTSSQITTNDIDYIKFRKKYGENVSFLGTYDNPNKLPILDSILGVKYIFTNIKDSESDYILIDNFYYIKKYLYKPINIKTSFYIYENPYAMNLGYLIPINHNEIYNQLQINTENSFDELNVLMKTLTGNNQDIMIEYPRKYEIKNGNIVYTFDINNNEKFIFLTNDYKINQYILGNPISDTIVLNKTKNIKMLLNSNAIIKIENEFSNENLEITTLENGIASLISDKIYLYWFDKKTFEKDIDLLKKFMVMFV